MRSAGHAPSHGMVPVSSRSRMASAWTEISSGDQRSKGEAHRIPVAFAKQRLDVLLEAQRLVRVQWLSRVGCAYGRLAADRKPTHRAPICEMPSERVRHRGQRALRRPEHLCDVLGRALRDSAAEGRGIAHALLEQRPGGFPMRQKVVVLAEELEARPGGAPRVPRSGG